MGLSLKKQFKILFLAGLMLLFISLFLDWYYLQVYNEDGELLAFWSYNPVREWTTHFFDKGASNKIKEPKNLSIPLIINVTFVIAILASAFSVLFKDPEQKKNLEKLYPYAYINIFVVILNLYYIFAFPIFYLFPHNLYFPYLIIEDENLELIYHYYVGPGYILQLIAFIFVFPYATFYYQTIAKFKEKKHTAEKVINRYIQHIQEPLDLDKLIAKEELKLKFDDLAINQSKKYSIKETVIKKRSKRRGVS
ncbi:MAG: hypothetical protein ACFFAN_04300 [Promethearchaeota archaeon]